MAWQQPKTSKIYLHPPLARRQVTVWPDLKLISKGVAKPRVVPAPGHSPGDDHGVRFLFGETAETVDWGRTDISSHEDGLPLPTMRARHGGLEIELRAFCSWDEEPVTYARLRITNDSPVESVATLGLMPRTGFDGLLIGMHGDYYASYRPLLEHWDMIPNTWRWREGALADRDLLVQLAEPEGAEIAWVERHPTNPFAKHYLRVRAALRGHGHTTLYLALSRGRGVSLNEEAYNLEQARAVERWRGELAAIRRRPRLPEKTLNRMFQSLVCQCLQMLARTDDGVIWPRQGGRHDGVWPVEAMEWLRALDRLGLLEWSSLGYAFFRDQQLSEGDDAGRFQGINSLRWTNETGGVLFGLGYHLICRDDPSYFRSWRQSLLDAVAWIEAQRAKTRDNPEALGYGLFPAGLGHDWQWSGQYWCFTDGICYIGLREAARALAHYRDPEAERIQASVEDYRDCLQRTLSLLVEGCQGDEVVYIPNVLGLPDAYPPFGPYHADGPTNLLRAGIIRPQSELFEQLERYWRQQGWMQNGLTARMTDSLMTHGYMADPWAGHTWYTSFSDMHWFYAWLERGERQKAAETLWAQLQYGMSPEFYMLERYADNDPTFAPWQPNASANGRTIMMLLDFYGEE